MLEKNNSIHVYIGKYMFETKFNSSSSQDELLRALKKLRDLLSVISVNDSMNGNRGLKIDITEELFNNARKITAFVDEIESGFVQNQQENEIPLIFDLYDQVPQIRSICINEINPQAISKSDIRWLIAIEKIVLKEINKTEINLIGLAYQVAVSERQLHRNIKKFLGLTPNNYIRILKLHKAKQHLEQYTFRTIAEVSYAVGFNDAHYFSKIFFNQYGKKPREIIPAKY